MLRHQAGFSILTSLIVAIALVASLAFLLIGSGIHVPSQMVGQRTAQLITQSQLIIQRIVKCATDYPSGSNGDLYPLGTGVAAKDLTCPGNSNQNLWTGVDGVYYPVPITGFNNWVYTKASPTTISITTSDPSNYSSAIAAAAARIGPPASATASTLTIKIIE